MLRRKKQKQKIQVAHIWELQVEERLKFGLWVGKDMREVGRSRCKAFWAISRSQRTLTFHDRERLTSDSK